MTSLGSGSAPPRSGVGAGRSISWRCGRCCIKVGSGSLVEVEMRSPRSRSDRDGASPSGAILGSGRVSARPIAKRE